MMANGKHQIVQTEFEDCNSASEEEGTQPQTLFLFNHPLLAKASNGGGIDMIANILLEKNNGL